MQKSRFKNEWNLVGWNMLTRIKSGFKALILLQIFLTNSSSCKCKLLMLTNLSGLWKDMDSWTRSSLALSTFIGISVLITRLVKTSPLTIRDSLFLPSFRGFMSLFWFQSHLSNIHYGPSMMSQGKTPKKDPPGGYKGLRGLSKASFTWKDP